MREMEMISVPRVRDYLLDLQDRICAGLELEDGAAGFLEDDWSRGHEENQEVPALGGGGRSRVLSNGAAFE